MVYFGFFYKLDAMSPYCTEYVLHELSNDVSFVILG